MTFTPSGRHVLLVDNVNGCIEVYRRDGVFVHVWSARLPWHTACTADIYGVCVLSNGFVVVTDHQDTSGALMVFR